MMPIMRNTPVSWMVPQPDFRKPYMMMARHATMSSSTSFSRNPTFSFTSSFRSNWNLVFSPSIRLLDGSALIFFPSRKIHQMLMAEKITNMPMRIPELEYTGMPAMDWAMTMV